MKKSKAWSGEREQGNLFGEKGVRLRAPGGPVVVPGLLMLPQLERVSALQGDWGPRGSARGVGGGQPGGRREAGLTLGGDGGWEHEPRSLTGGKSESRLRCWVLRSGDLLTSVEGTSCPKVGFLGSRWHCVGGSGLGTWVWATRSG